MKNKKNRIPVIMGNLKIPEGTEYIEAREYEGEAALVRVTVPGSVKRIGVRAFADCGNLRTVTLQEGISAVESNAFTGCMHLKSLRIPDSLTEITGWAFFECGLEKAVRNASGDRLLFCPAAEAGSVYTVPEHVKEIGTHAFINLPELKKVILPEGLERIRSLAFCRCGLTEITIPESVRIIEDGAFTGCKDLTMFKRERTVDYLTEQIDYYRWKGIPFLRAVKAELPGTKYWETPEFQELAAACESGTAEAFWRMAEYFREKARHSSAGDFYTGAFHFWLYRAFERGSGDAGRYLENRLKDQGEHPGMKSVCMTEELYASCDGVRLRALGFLFFKEGIRYCLGGKDREGVVEVSVWTDEDGPDEDGYGREEYYDYWYLDDCLTLAPDGKCLQDYSHIDRSSSAGRKAFAEQYELAVKYVRERRQKAIVNSGPE